MVCIQHFKLLFIHFCKSLGKVRKTKVFMQDTILIQLNSFKNLTSYNIFLFVGFELILMLSTKIMFRIGEEEN